MMGEVFSWLCCAPIWSVLSSSELANKNIWDRDWCQGKVYGVWALSCAGHWCREEANQKGKKAEVERGSALCLKDALTACVCSR